MEAIAKIKKALEEQRIVIGYQETVEAVNDGTATEVHVAKNTPADKLTTLRDLAGLKEIPVNMLELGNDEVGVICKKPFSISVLSLK